MGQKVVWEERRHKENALGETNTLNLTLDRIGLSKGVKVEIPFNTDDDDT